MGEDLVICWLIGEYHPNLPIMEDTVAPKFSKPIRMLDSFTKTFLQKDLIIRIRFLIDSSGLWLKPTE